MDYIKEQFLQSLSSDDTSMHSVTSRQELDPEEDSNQDESEFAVLAGEAQDPTDNEPNHGDIWDSLTSLIAEKINKEKDRKGKGKAE
ncbi:hypothetical protein ACSBR1_012691 [Camellia fascicularis]